MKFRYLGAALLMGVAGSAAAQATTLAQLRARLEGMHAVAPLSAQVRLSQATTSGKKDHPKTVSGSIALHVHDGAQGLDLRLPAGVLAKASQESAALARDADAPAPTRAALRAVDPVMLSGMADFAPVLLHKLEGATLTGQRDVTRDGATVHEMTFAIPSQVGKADKGSIDSYTGELSVWLNADGVPVAVRESRRYKGSKFFIHFSFFNTDDYALQMVGQRLVVHHLHGDNGGAGMGSNSETTLDVVLTPESAEGTS